MKMEWKWFIAAAVVLICGALHSLKGRYGVVSVGVNMGIMFVRYDSWTGKAWSWIPADHNWKPISEP